MTCGSHIHCAQRNQSTLALLKDRHSRSGLASKSETMRKNGAGAHNWGSYQQEGEYELEADQDVRLETDADALANGHEEDDLQALELDDGAQGAFMDRHDDTLGPLPSDNNNNANKQNHQEGGENKDLMKEAIAASPSDSMSSFDSFEAVKRPGRRLSNVSDQERERARVYREGVMHKPSGSIDLANIARTSYGIAQSPPSVSYLGTSPTKAKVSSRHANYARG
ncbi:hypothetical protein BD324DRAFT_111993 [Kockovaella imperatae]|uniref:Hyaluronan/mRNA-binding protein domain-containing protein n=1 Tax=Kockovaella imperatae TaxID=4999 RepID=A0A1Y1UAE0_9TREE|nr:hypothetical protein BD324DRAFT_111993 [Kockovaella imperatae]ORX35003.1 hypothetical protein BD324DRAFT_111993 [Kockovaella imperatae]